MMLVFNNDGVNSTPQNLGNDSGMDQSMNPMKKHRSSDREFAIPVRLCFEYPEL